MLINWQKQLETPSPCRPYPPSSSLSASQLAAHGSPTSLATKIGSPSQQRKAELFSRFDVRETSFHVYTGRIDLHLCDDALPGTLSSWVAKQTWFNTCQEIDCNKNMWHGDVMCRHWTHNSKDVDLIPLSANCLQQVVHARLCHQTVQIGSGHWMVT